MAASIHETRLVPPGSSAWTFGRHIFIRPGLDAAHRARLLEHELVHVDQYAELGIPRFLARYLREYLVGLVRLRSHRAAYLNISLEREARGELRTVRPEAGVVSDDEYEEWEGLLLCTQYAAIVDVIYAEGGHGHCGSAVCMADTTKVFRRRHVEEGNG